MLNDLEAPRHIVGGLGDVGTDLTESASALRAGACAKVDNLFARQVFRQRTPRRLAFYSAAAAITSATAGIAAMRLALANPEATLGEFVAELGVVLVPAPPPARAEPVALPH